MLPTQSLCLVPVVWPQERDEPWAQRRRAEARRHRQWVDEAQAMAEAMKREIAAAA